MPRVSDPNAARPSGGGRSTLRAKQLREEGRQDEADAIAPPSERKVPEEQRCGSRLPNSGDDPALVKHCNRRKGTGTDHLGYGYCSKHGGSTEAGNKSAMREMGRDLMEKYKGQQPFGGDRRDPTIANMTPESALLEEVRRSVAMVRFLEERIGRWNLNPSREATIEAFAQAGKTHKDMPRLRAKVDEILGDLEETDPASPSYLPALTTTHERTGMSAFSDAREWLYLYREERGHLAKVSKMALDAGVAQRLVSIAEDQGRTLASAIRAVLSALNLSPEQAALVPQVVPTILRAVATDQPIPSLKPHALPAPPSATN